MKIIFKHSRIVLPALLLLFMTTSCLEDQTKKDAANEQKEIDNYLATKLQNAVKLPSGVYLQLDNGATPSIDSTTPQNGQTVVVEFTGEYTDGTVFETTDESIGKALFPDLYYVYGPYRIKVGTSMVGFDSTIHYFHIGNSGTMLIPSEMARFDYKPVVYHVKLLDIIDPQEQDTLQFPDYMEKHGFDSANNFGNGIYWKRIDDTALSATPAGFDQNDSAIFNLTARYAESTIYSGDSNRIFYPLANAPLQVKKIYNGQNNYFPFIPAIDSALNHMAVGDTLQILVNSGLAFGTNGFNDPYYGVTIVPPYMSVLYEIGLVARKKH